MASFGFVLTSWIRFVAWFFIVLFAIVGCDKNEDAVTFGPRISSSELKFTLVSPTMYGEIDKDRNIIFCSTFQLAWNSLRNEVFKEDVKVEKGGPNTAYLNKLASEKQDLSDNEFVARAGFIKDGIVEKINEELKMKFPDQKEQYNPEGLQPNDIVAYAFLFKDLKFKEKFETLDDPLYFGTGESTPVGAFGVFRDRRNEVTRQVSIYDYINDDDFIIIIAPESREDEIVLAKIAPSKDLAETDNIVRKRIKKGKTEQIQEHDKLIVPKLKLNIRHNFTDLEGHNILNRGFLGYWIARALQDIMFKLNEEGATIKSRAEVLVMAEAPGPDRPQPKMLIFDKPFLLCLRKKNGERPYFVMWVGNAELMEMSERRPK